MSTDQYQTDLRCLEERLESLRTEREIQPKIIEQVYSLRSIRMFPLAVEFILPSSFLDSPITSLDIT
ncbi:MAG: hypothetical protein GQ565_07965 [Candidatus Aegiribacteria sp.]|nr:hypothetical protein [Candidatus Aegiribacteria sp.]